MLHDLIFSVQFSITHPDAIQNERHRLESFANNVFYENEKYVFSEQYLCEGAIVKVFLQPFSTIDSNNAKHTLDVFLVLHRSGTAILTIAIPLAGNFTSLDINNMMIVSSHHVNTLEICESIASISASVEGLDLPRIQSPLIERSVTNGINWVKLPLINNSTLLNVFAFYRLAIISSLNKKIPVSFAEINDWVRNIFFNVHPALFVKKTTPPIQNMPEWLSYYKGLLTDFFWCSGKKEKISDELIRQDCSLSDDEASYFFPEASYVLYFRAYYENFIKYCANTDGTNEEILWWKSCLTHQNFLNLLLLQKGTLSTVSQQLKTFPRNRKSLMSLKLEMLNALAEYDSFEVIDRGAWLHKQKIARNSMGIAEKYQNVKSRLESIEKILDVITTEERYFRDNLIKAGSLMFAIFSGYVAIKQFVDSLMRTDMRKIDLFGCMWGNSINLLIKNNSESIALYLWIIVISLVLIIIFWNEIQSIAYNFQNKFRSNK